MIVTIDGPAGAGKSTAARELARRLGFEYLDTGAMYRAVTWVCLSRGVDLADRDAVAELASRIRLEFRLGRIFADGSDVSDTIRTTKVTEESRHVAANLQVRARLVEMQREIAGSQNVVTEGRDQGTVAFPHAECKFFLTADPVERAKRRQAELERRGEKIGLEELIVQLGGRDQRDVTREVGALKRAADAVEFDTSELDADSLVLRLEQIVRERMNSRASAKS